MSKSKIDLNDFEKENRVERIIQYLLKKIRAIPSDLASIFEETSNARDEAVAAKDLAVPAASQVALDKIATAADRVQTGLDRTATGQDRSSIQTTLDNFFETFSLADGLGTYNASTNIATRKEAGTTFTPTSVAVEAKGKFFDVVVEGTQTITGVSILMKIGGVLISRGTKWDYIPPADTGFSKALDLEKLISVNPYSYLGFVIKDLNDRDIAGITLAGEWYASRYKAKSIPATALGQLDIKPADLNTELSSLLLQPLNPATGYIFGLVDKDGYMPFAVKTNGAVQISKLDFQFPDASIPQAKLDLPTQAKLDAGGVVNVNDRVMVADDGLLRGKMTDIGVMTSYNGWEFTPFPRQRTPSLSGINNSGTSLEFRRSSGMCFRGHRYIGIYNPGVVMELNDKGLTTNVPSTVGLVQGDYYKVGASTGSTLTINAVGYNPGDLAVYDVPTGNFLKKAAPTPANALVGHFWIVGTAGTFDKISLAVGDIIYVCGKQLAGGPSFLHYSKITSGEFFFADSFVPASFVPPATLADGLVYIASSAGTFDSKVFAKNDYLVRFAGSWHLLPGEAITTVAANSYFNFKCDFSDSWEVRRTDVSNTQVGLTAKSKTAFVQKNNSDEIVVVGDSMVDSLSTLAAALAPRSVTTLSYGGAKSAEIKSMMEYNILAKGDPHKGKFLIQYHGQNNLADLAMLKQSVPEILNMTGARDGRFLLLSVLGDRNCTYNGVRLVCDLQEAAFNGVAGTSLLDIESHYQDTYPGNWINIRKRFLDLAATMTEPDLQFPGKTQAQVAALYGIPPLSFWLDYSLLTYPAAQWNFIGYHNSDSVAPAGGADKDYYITSVGTPDTTLGAFWLKAAGIWTLITWDRIHVRSGPAKAAYANLIKNWLTLNKQ